MYRIVQKFGGTSVADTQRIKEAAKKVAFEHSQGHQVVVVVSAMAGVTNKLIEFKNAPYSSNTWPVKVGWYLILAK